jgi:hypothetical protein
VAFAACAAGYCLSFARALAACGDLDATHHQIALAFGAETLAQRARRVRLTVQFTMLGALSCACAKLLILLAVFLFDCAENDH